MYHIFLNTFGHNHCIFSKYQARKWLADQLRDVPVDEWYNWLEFPVYPRREESRNMTSSRIWCDLLVSGRGYIPYAHTFLKIGRASWRFALGTA